MAISFDELTGQVPAQAETTAPTRPGTVSFEELTGVAPPQSAWEKTKSFFAQGDQVLGAPKAMQGVEQLGQEVKALSNMLVGIPGGVAGVGMDIGSRISSLAIGEGAKAAGVRARATAEHTNALWGKVTGALGLTQDASGSNIQNWMEKGIAATDVGGEKLEQATGGVLTKETAQSVRDTLLNALGVKGMGPAGIAKIAKGKATRGTGEALAADQAIRESKARIAEEARVKAQQPPDRSGETPADTAKRLQEDVHRVRTESVAAATATPEVVKQVYETAIKNRHPLDEALTGKIKTPPSESPTWDTMVVGLVEPPKMAVPPVPQGPGVTPKTRIAEPTIIGKAPDMTVSGFDKLRRGLLLSKAEADAIRSLGRSTPEVAVEGVAAPRATLAERLAAPLPARGPGVVPKTRLTEGTVLGKEAPVQVAELHGVAERLIDSGVAKLQRGELISAAEAKAIRALKPLPDQGVIVGPNGKPYFQRGAVDSSLLKVLGLMGLGAVAGTALYNWFQSSGGLSGDNARDAAMGLGAAGVVKGKGGAWHAPSLKRLSTSLGNPLTTVEVQAFLGREGGSLAAIAEAREASAGQQWANKAVTNYFNRHAGTATDPIKDLKLPDGTPIEALTDAMIVSQKASDWYTPNPKTRVGREQNEMVKDMHPDEPLYELSAIQKLDSGEYANGKFREYLEHVGDYVKSRNLTPEQLQQMDLPRAIRETVANDNRIAAEAIKDFTKPNPQRMADTQSLPEYKTYPPVEQGSRTFSFNKDGSIRTMQSIELPAGEVQYSWREIALPKELTPAQARSVKTLQEASTSPSAPGMKYVATDAKGKILIDRFSEQPAQGTTPQEAWLKGQLAQEGNALGHCVGTYGDHVLSGQSRIISLRDQNGKSYATVELEPAGGPRTWEGFKAVFTGKENIAQIKGPGNGAPPKYVEPYVQDFVKSGKWGDVQDLEHAGMVKAPDGSLMTLKERAATELPLLERDLAATEKLLAEGGYGRSGWTREQVEWNRDALIKDIAQRKSELGKADPKLLAAVAAATGLGAYLYNNPPEDKFTTLAAGLMGATVMRKAPSKYDAMLSSKNTAGLMEAFKAGGKEMESAARAIHDATRGQLERSLYTFKDKIDVEQAVQDAYTNTFQALSEGKFEGGSEISTYLYRAAKNAAIDMQWKKNVRPQEIASAGDRQGGTDFGAEGGGESFALAEGVSELTPERMASNQQMVNKMQEALDKLPEQQREMFKARELDGMEYEDIAKQFDVPIGTVRSTLSRAKDNLQKSLSVYKPESQSGMIDQKLLAGVGMVAGGAVVGGLLADDASKGRVVGALMGLTALAASTGPARAALMRGTTRLMEVDPELRRAVRESEMQAGQEVSAASDAISGFVKPVKKLSAEAQVKLDEAYSQADPAGVKAALSGSPEAMAGYQKLRAFLDKTGDRLKAFGRFKEGVPDYLPLLVKDYKGLMDRLGLDVRTGLEKYLHNANTKSIKETGNALNEVEKSLLVNDYLLRDPATSYLPGFAKHRRLRMTPETRPFYHTMDDALIRYAHAAVEDIAEAKFFGKDLRTSKVGGQQYTNLDNSIGALTARAIEEGRMTPEQAVEVQAVLRARYGKGKMAPSGWAQDARNIAGAGLLGQIGSGLVQTSEALFSTYHHGIRPAIEAVGIQLTGRGIKPGEFGLANHVIEEVIGSRASGKVLSGLLKLNLLATFDQMGMGQNLTASFVKNKRLASTPKGQVELAAKWGADYGPDMPQLIKELQASSSKSRTPLVDSLLYQELSDVRPTSRAEAPELYNLHPNARLMYHLKQFMLTQADIMYRDAVVNIKSGEPKKVATGLKNLALYSTALSMAVIPSDAIKNWMMGRGLKLDKIDYVDNFVRNFGLSRYTMNQVMRSDKPGEEMVKAGVKMVTPPVFSVGQTLGKGLSDPKELMPLVPLGGRIVYNRELGGNEKALRNDQLQKRLDLRDAREARNPELKAARLRRKAAAKKASDAILRRAQ
ncbi:MAG: sigma-70 family RNA polymerase sigma factor [Ilumatobacteraceae bacterium]|nr:sigma-70 family RNA polymerase sigma factor [Ilumatobacteraceae bacterium]